MVVITRDGVTLELHESIDFADALRKITNDLASDCICPSNIIDQEEYLKNLINHFSAAFPLCNVLATNKNHTILGQYKHFHYEQPAKVASATGDLE
ncbi:5327_t:CDS:2, partial [Ambispora gerdemannii]